MANLNKLFNFGRESLIHLENPELEAKVLLLAATGLSEEEYYTSPTWIPPLSLRRKYYRLLALRSLGFPAAYLTGQKEFWSLPFLVGQGVLIPRPETELVVEEVLQLVLPEKKARILDIGTGCGNIAISLAKERPSTFILATDISPDALAWAKRNLEFHQVKNVELIQGDGLSLFKKSSTRDGFDLIVSNPPYISITEWEELSPSIKNYEPSCALVAGPQGLDVIEKLVREAPLLLKPGGTLILEIGWNQAQKVKDLFGPQWESVSFQFDHQGIPRVCRAVIKNEKG